MSSGLSTVTKAQGSYCDDIYNNNDFDNGDNGNDIREYG